MSRSDGVKKFDAYENFEALKVFSEKNEIKARMQADLAREVAGLSVWTSGPRRPGSSTAPSEASDQTVTAITMCDVAHFVVEDEDRILDGRWTVSRQGHRGDGNGCSDPRTQQGARSDQAGGNRRTVRRATGGS